MKDNPISLFHELESYVRGSKDRLHRYMYACILEQRLADLLLLSRCGVHPEDRDRLAVRLASQRSLCVQAASDIAEGTQEAGGAHRHGRTTRLPNPPLRRKDRSCSL